MAAPSDESMVKWLKWPWPSATATRTGDNSEAVRQINARLVVLSPKGVKIRLADLRISREVLLLPPMAIYGMGTRHLLRNWADSYLAKSNSLVDLTRDIEHMVVDSQVELKKGGADWPLEPTRDESGAGPDTNIVDPCARHWQGNKASILHKMLDVTAQASETCMQLDTPSIDAQLSSLDPERSRWLSQKKTQLEMVGLIPANRYGNFLRAMNKSVDSLCLFSRETLRDDSRGSLRERVEGQYGEQRTRLWARGRWDFDVFAIEGLVDAPGLSKSSARDLLSKIANYADTEQRIVVVPRRAYTHSDGTDLTDYYVALGFDKVEMKDGSHELVYTRISSLGKEAQAENRNMMFGVDRWIRI